MYESDFHILLIIYYVGINSFVGRNIKYLIGRIIDRPINHAMHACMHGNK